MKTLLPLRIFLCGVCLATAISSSAQESRTPISSLPYTISAQGSYYLTRSLTAIGSTAGITISADNVTLDLNGFALIGGGSGSVAGINVPAARKNILIRNGTVRGWTNGGVNAANASDSFVQGLRVSNNTVHNFFSTQAALSIGNGSAVTDCVVANNTNCDGISAGNACAVRDCVTRANFAGAGIRVMDSCYVVGNISDSNRSGIITGSGNRIESNSWTSNGNEGILISAGATQNIVLHNSARNNNPNYNIASGNVYGRIVDLTTGSAGAVFGNSAPSALGLATTDPWSNFAY